MFDRQAVNSGPNATLVEPVYRKFGDYSLPPPHLSYRWSLSNLWQQLSEQGQTLIFLGLKTDLEGKSDAAADRARRLHQVNCATILT